MNKICLMLAYLACGLFPGTGVQSQYYYYNSRFYDADITWELGVSAGAMNSLTDLGQKTGRGRNFIRDLNWRCSRPAYSVFGKMMYRQNYALSLQGTVGKIAAYDSMAANKRNAPGRYRRNLQVESRILELLLLAEIYPLSLLTAGEHPVSLLVPYFIAGVGYFHFNPVAVNGPLRVHLRPLSTEGQGFPEYPQRKRYALNQCNLPIGFGFKYEISALLIGSIECLYRKLFTDYLDDVSETYVDPAIFYKRLPPQDAALAATMADRHLKTYPPFRAGDKRGNPENKDAYLTLNLKMAFALGRERR